MAFDQSTRNRLARFVSDTRSLLAEEFTRQLQHVYGLDPATGDAADPAKLTLDNAQRETARLLRDTMEHYLAAADTSTAAKAKKARQEVLGRIVREQAFTVLNRLCALRMAEARGLLIESIAKGYQSKGFKLYQRLAGTALGETGACYRAFLFSVFDEFAVDLPVLFDRFSPQGRLFPRDAALLAVLNEVNHAEIDPLWAEDETIGWIYQYFNSVEERRQMRSESQAPRNSRELAVRNQFFTPRYVVEFLTDNTLGRIWYEMTQGATALKNSCRYLVRRPSEIFLAEGEEAPEPPESEEPAEDLSQEELLKKPVYIPHRPLKDPRDIKMLDPACGSMHFGLYAFDLFERIYDEAWDLEGERGADAFIRPEGLKPLHETYDSKEAFLRDVPRLIIERNIHGIDIDPRAVQIAGLSLWLRAQRSWQTQNVKAQDRPQIQRSNIVCAEPMPGEADMLEEFLKGLRDDRLETLIRRVLHVPEHQQVRATARMAEALCDLVRTVWKEMELAGEAGSLLKIEESLAAAIAKGQEEWEEKLPLFRIQEFGLGEAKPRTSYVKFVPGEEEDFWNRAEAMVLAALHDYAEHADGSGVVRKRLFANDASQGFAFIDLCRHQFDVALTNPPFGSPAIASRQYLAGAIPDSKTDIGMAFVTRFIMRLSARGRLGAITNRVFVANDSLDDWRVHYLMGHTSALAAFFDLGYGVLDEALVEAASYVIERDSNTALPVPFFRVLDERDKSGAAEDLLLHNTPRSRSFVFWRRLDDFGEVPGAVLAYQLPRMLLQSVMANDSLEGLGGKAAQGLIPADDFRFVRLAWEVPPQSIGTIWRYYAKGGEYSPYWDDVHLAAKWKDDGKEIRNFYGDNGRLRSRPQNLSLYGASGVTYPERTTSDFSPRALQRGTIFSATGQGIFWRSDAHHAAYIAGAYSRPFKMIVDAMYGSGDSSVSGSAATHYRSGLLSRLPVPISQVEKIAGDARKMIAIAFTFFLRDETSRYFSFAVPPQPLLAEAVQELERERVTHLANVLRLHQQVEDVAFEDLGFKSNDRTVVDTVVGPHPLSYGHTLTNEDQNQIRQLWMLSESALVEAAVAVRGASRQLTKKAYCVDRRLELVSHICQRSAAAIAEFVIQDQLVPPGAVQNYCHALVSWAFGCAMGRWDVDKAGDSPCLDQVDFFGELPVNPPAAATSEGADLSRGDGVLCHDPGDERDVCSCVRSVLQLSLGTSASKVEDELCALLNERSLEDYIGGPTRFFDSHLSKYSKSRRVAPIYLPLSLPSGDYTLWLYYHRLTDQTLYTCVNDFVDPRLKQVSEEASRLRGKSTRSSAEEKDLERLSDLELELKDFRDELLRLARFWKPNLNDGVQITAAPLWRLFQHRQWQNRLKETWEKLEAGEYDWAHLALSIWPDRVVRASHKDRSYAIAHDLEDRLWHEVEVEKVGRGGRVTTITEWQPRDLSEAELNQIIAEAKQRPQGGQS